MRQLKKLKNNADDFMSFDSFFSEVIFKIKMEKFCSGDDFEDLLYFYDVSDWRFFKNDENICILKFEISSGSTVFVDVINFGEFIEFSIDSILIFKNYEKLPDSVSALLLTRNSEQQFGFWCIEEIENKNAYSFMNNAEVRLLDQKLFLDIIKSMIVEYIYFEEVVKNIS